MYLIALNELSKNKVEENYTKSFFHINPVTVWLLVENITQTHILTQGFLSQLSTLIINFKQFFQKKTKINCLSI